MSREQIFNLNIADTIKGIVGCGSTMLGLVASHLDQVEAWLRIGSLVVGISVGVATFLSIRRRNK